MTTTTPEAVATGSATNSAAATPSIPAVKDATQAAADRLRKNMAVDNTTGTAPIPKENIVAELATFDQTPESLAKLATSLHNLNAAAALASGTVAHEHWKNQNADERGPIVSILQLHDGESTTFTHVPSSVERVPGKTETVTVYGQVNIQRQTNIGRNVGEMSNVRKHLRANAAGFMKS